MQAPGHRIARGWSARWRARSSTPRGTWAGPSALCVASNRGHRRVYERIAAHDPSGAAEAMFTHITEAGLVRRSAPGDPVRLDRWQAPPAAAPRYGMALGLVSVARHCAPSPYER
ncbi:hypothetical protein [Streptomyces sp. NPDC048825]|uniref:hypothetical protein n=1 Tax=Streptomyces sp. NPDC048825 TaxID=3365592 RepID=UPI003712F0F3